MIDARHAMLLVIMAVNVAVSLLAFRTFRREDGRGAEHFVFVPHKVARGDNGIGMLLSHFAHGSVLHLAFNMLALYSFSGTVLDVVGPARFLLIYVVAGLGSDLVVFALRKDDPSYRCLGASGSVFGIIVAAIVIDPTTSIVLFLFPVPIPGPVFMIGYAIVAVVLITRPHRGTISHEAHLGGAILGLALAGLLAPRGLEPLLRWFGRWL